MKASKKVITLTVAILAVSSLTISACAPGFKADVLDANNPVAPEQIDSKNINDKKNENPKPSSDKNDDSSNSQNIKMDGTEDTSASSIDQNLLSNTQTITVSEQNSTNETNTPPPNPETSSPAESKDDQTTSAAATAAAAAAATTPPQNINQNPKSTAIIVNDANKDVKSFQIISVHTEIPKSLNTKADANVDDKVNKKTTPENFEKGWWDSVTGLFNSWTDDSNSDVKLEPIFNLVSNFKLGNDLIFITTQHKWFKTEDKKENPNSQFYEKTFENLGIKINFQVFVQHNWKAIKLTDFPEKIYYALKVKKLSDNSTTQAIIAVYKVKSPMKTVTLNINSDQLVKNLTKNDKGSETVNLANWTFANMMWHAKNLK